MAPKQIVLAFDAYGTLLSTQSIAEKLARHFGDERAKTIATAWRKHQLEYTWRLNSMGQYQPFSSITRSSLHNALHESSVTLDEAQTEDLMKAYDSLTIFPDVAQCLESLSTTPDIKCVVFSNGTHDMVSNSVRKSPDLKKHADVFSDIVVVEDVRKFKPAPEVYYDLARKVGKDADDKGQMADVWLVSGNPFDVVGARAVGMNAIWVDRAGLGWPDGLVQGPEGRPTEVVKSLDQVPATVMSANSDELTSQWREGHGERQVE